MMQARRDEFFPKATMWPDEIKGLDLVLADALKNKFVTAPLTPDAGQGHGADPEGVECGDRSL